MTKLIALALCLASVCSTQALAQKPWKQKREKHFEPAARLTPRDCAGRYLGPDESYWIELRVGDDGRIGATLREGEREARLEDARLDGATLRATKVYAGGGRARFVATFGDRVRGGVHTFGLTDETADIELPGITLTRVFYRRVGE